MIFQKESNAGEHGVWEYGVARIGEQKGRRIELSNTPDCTEDTGYCGAIMGVDDLELLNCQNSTDEVSCDFEDNSFCSWQQDQQDDMDWELMTGPDGQHNQEGKFLKLWNSENQGKTASVESIILPPDQKYCFSFKYKMYGDTIGSLRLALKSLVPSGVETVWQQTGSLNNMWHTGQKQFTPKTPVSLLLQGEARGKYSPILLDKLSLTLGACPKTASCGFENGKCGWHQRGNINWMSATGQMTEGVVYTPDHDHTTKSSAGKFLYANPIDSIGKRAILESEKWKNGTKCLNIWYVTKDNDGFLRVLERYKDGVGNNITKAVWEMPKYGLPSWQLAQVTVQGKEDTMGYKVQISASIGTKNTSLMAIDDIKIKDGACPALDHCSFEQGTCGYGNFIGDQFDWIVFSASEESDFVAPPLDMSLGSTEGHSFIAPLTGHKAGHSATFITSLVPKQYQCLVFWYNFWNSSKEAELKVTMMTGGVADIELLQLRYQPSNQWKQISLR